MLSSLPSVDGAFLATLRYAPYVSAEGRREVLGIAVGLVAILTDCCSAMRPRPAETEAFWTEFLRSLVARGISGVRLVLSDAHIGLKNAIGQVLGATWQR